MGILSFILVLYHAEFLAVFRFTVQFAGESAMSHLCNSYCKMYISSMLGLVFL